MEKPKQQQEGPQSFELLELLFRNLPAVKTMTKGKPGPSNIPVLQDFESFQARFQSFIDQIPSYLHSSSKPGFFAHFFLGSFSTVLDTKLNKEKIGINNIYYRFDSAKTLKIVAEIAKKTHIFIFTEETEEEHSKSKQISTRKFEFTEQELESINAIRKKSKQDKLKEKIEIKLVKIDVSKNVHVTENKKIVKNGGLPPVEFPFKKITVQRNPDNYLENDIEKLSEMNVESVETTFREILEYVKNTHTALNLSNNVYGSGARESNHQGFLAGVLDNFRYRYNTRIYLEQFAGKGYADIVLLVRGDNRSTHSIPIIIELKAGTREKTEPSSARQQAEGYALGFQPNTSRVLTLSDNVICVGFNLDYTSTEFIDRILKDIKDIIDKYLPAITDTTLKKSIKDKVSEFIEIQDPHLTKIIDDWNWSKNSLYNKIERHLYLTFSSKIIQQETENLQPTIIEILASIKNWFNLADGEILKEEMQKTLERIYNTFPGTPEKSENHYFSRFLLGQSILINDQDYEKNVFIYHKNDTNLVETEQPYKPAVETKGRKVKEKTYETLKESDQFDKSHAITTVCFTPNNEDPVVLLNIVESNQENTPINKKIELNDDLIKNKNIIKLNIQFRIDKKDKVFDEYFKILSVDNYNDLEDYNNNNPNESFQGGFERILYPENFKESFDDALDSQKKTSTSGDFTNNYKKLFEQDIKDAIYPFKSIIEKEAHSQAILHGTFSHYSDLKLSENPETRAVVLTEFQTGRGKRIDMLIHGIGPSLDPKEYKPVGLEIKGPRKNKTVDALKKEANQQIGKDYKTGFYKGLTDGDKAYILPVIVDLGDKVITLGEASEAIVSHSSIMNLKKHDQIKPSSKIIKPSANNITQREIIYKIENLNIPKKSLPIEERVSCLYLEAATASNFYNYWLQQHDIADIVRIEYGENNNWQINQNEFEIVGSLDQLDKQLQRFQNNQTAQRRIMIVNLSGNHWVTLVVSRQDELYYGYYVDSLGNELPNNVRSILESQRILNIIDFSRPENPQQRDGHNCGLWVLENAYTLNQMLQVPHGLDWAQQQLEQQRDDNYFIKKRINLTSRLRNDLERRNHLQDIILAPLNAQVTQQMSVISDLPALVMNPPAQLSDKPPFSDLTEPSS